MSAAPASPVRPVLPYLPHLSGTALKLIALITMTIDHLAASDLITGAAYPIMRIIGRTAFPIYCFLLVEGFFYTHSRWSYLKRLAGFALLSELPFDLGLFHKLIDPVHQSVMVTLALGLLTIWGMECLPDWIDKRLRIELPLLCRALLMGCIAVTGCAVGAASGCDYGGGGVLLIVLFYLFRCEPIALLLAVTAELYLVWGGIEIMGVVAFLPILCYDGTKGKQLGGKIGKYGFYAYYPLHLALLAILTL